MPCAVASSTGVGTILCVVSTAGMSIEVHPHT